MPNTKHVSDLKDYSEVLSEVSFGSPVFLTENGHSCYAIMDIHDFERKQSSLQLMNELLKGRKSGEEYGWLSSSDVKEYFLHKQT